MKKTFLWLFAWGLLGGMTFTSCNDDDDNGPVIDPVLYSANFSGEVETTLDSGRGEMTFPATSGQKVLFTRDSLDCQVMVYKDWTGMGVNYGDFSIPVTFTTQENGKTSVTGECVQTLYKESKGYEATLGVTGHIFRDAIISGESRKDSCSLLITVNMPVSPAMTLDFKLDYTGVAE